jgi:hypothetical protein
MQKKGVPHQPSRITGRLIRYNRSISILPYQLIPASFCTTSARTSLRRRACLTLRSAARPHFPSPAVRKAPDRVRGWSCLSCSLFYQPALTRVCAGRFPCIYLSSSVEFPTSARTAELGFRSPLVEAGLLIPRVKPATVRLRDFLIVFRADNGRINGGVPVTRKTNLKRRPTSGAPINHLDLHSPLVAKYDVTRDIGIVLGTCSPLLCSRISSPLLGKLLVSVYVTVRSVVRVIDFIGAVTYHFRPVLRDACTVLRDKCIWRRTLF